MSAFRALLVSESTILLRDRMALFFTLAFPLIFILIFGFLMGDIGDVSQSRLGVFVAADAGSGFLDEAIAAAGSMAIESFDSLELMREAVTDRRIDFALSWDGDSLQFLYDANRVQENFAFQQVARGLATDFNLRRQGVTPAISVEPIDVGRSHRPAGSTLCSRGSSRSRSFRRGCSPSPAISPR